MEILVKTALALTLLFTVSASGSAQSGVATASHEPQNTGEVAAGGPRRPAACHDYTPHTETFVRVDKKVQLEVVDWGGADKPATMVLLTGLGDNAHVYDQFAYQFTDYFHVIGITRRGFLPSSQPESGYDVSTRAHDDIEVLKHFGISEAVFVGHSLAGSELSELGLKYNSYVEKLVYLDAFDLAKRFERSEIPPVPYATRDYRSLQIFQAAQARLENTLRPEPSLCPGLKFDAKGEITDSTTPDWVRVAIFAGIAEKQNPEVNWADIDPPRLGIFDQPSAQAKLAYYWYLSPEEQTVFDARWPGIVQWYADTTDKFEQANAGKPTPVVYLLPNAPHYFFMSDQAFVVRRMLEFLLGKAGP